MMVRVFNTGTGNAKSAINYLMGKNDHTGKLRAVAPEWLHGSPSLFQLVCNSTDRKQKYVSGAISFRDNEHPSEGQIKNIMAAFKASFLPGLKEDDNYADAWIAHRDKSNLELHFVVAGTEIQSGRQLNIHPPGKRNIAHFQAFTQVMNQALGYDQVTPDPLKIALNEFEAKTDAGKKSRRVKRILSSELHSHIVSGRIANRDELITHLEGNYGEVTRIGKDYISIKLPGSSKAKRLKGPLFQADADYQELVKQHQKSKQPQKLTTEEYTQAKTTLEKLTFERAAYFAKRYKKKTTFKRTLSNRGKAHKASGGNVKPPLKRIQPEIQQVQICPADTKILSVVAATSAETGTEVSTHQLSKFNVETSTPSVNEDSHIPTVNPVSNAMVFGIEMEIGNLANLVSKLMIRAQTTTNAAYYEILHAQIVKLQHQMEVLNYRMQMEKAKDAQDAQPRDFCHKPKI
ncbi:relaxase [Undibacterium sp. LX40W]|uniref:Relaxase n=1 Tax=Undibacterium nitidum TaxID=2762298 RepID=A0A923HNB7_9BURK|nr:MULTISPECIES: relaxase/mobilization nuclease domain-containing protein [Undibacterium]MBC3881548.1 relaxase [Undibacterium nitidum]MBC3891670.1 relaxase [Undibacterium sp. LX40W]